MNYYLRSLVGLLYVIIGIYTMLLNVLPGNLDPKFLLMMGFVMICYGVYRIVHSIHIKNQKKGLDSGERQSEEG